MAENVLGTLFGDIADAIRSKTGGTETMKPAEFPEQISNIESSNVIEHIEIALDFSNGDQTETLPEGYSVSSATILKPENLTPENIAKDVEIAGIIGTHEGGGSTEEIIFPLQTVSGFALDSTYGVYIKNENPSPFVLESGKTYIVEWDGTTYECTAAPINDSLTGIGNTVLMGGADTGEPFSIAALNNGELLTYFALDTKTEHDIKISKKASGGVVEGTAKVTFCNYDGTELYSRLVFIGDDCPDPVTQGKLDTPTRASDVQYHYTFSGWGETQGGTASSTVLQNITADKTVYAAYSTELVKYTARFYDGDILMQESQVGYGLTATPPNTAKEGYNFLEWTPSDLTIYADTDFYGTWEEATYIYALANPATLPSGQLRSAVFTKNGERLVVSRANSSAADNLIIYNTTTKPYTLVSKTKPITTSGCYIQDVTINPSGTMVIATVICNSASSTEKRYKVYSVNGNSLTDVTTTYYTKPSISNSYKFQYPKFNSDGTRLIMYDSATYSMVVFDTTTTPFTEVATRGEVSYIFSSLTWWEASTSNPNVIYCGRQTGTMGWINIETLEYTTIRSYGSYDWKGILNNAQDKYYLFEHEECSIYSFDNTTHKLGSVKTVTYPVRLEGASSSTYIVWNISPDDKKIIIANGTTMRIFSLENDTFADITPPSTMIGGSLNPAISASIFDESGTRFVVFGTSSPYMLAYAVDPSVNK